jgi:hypothetical protein
MAKTNQSSMHVAQGQVKVLHDLLDVASRRHERQKLYVDVALNDTGDTPVCDRSLRSHHLPTPSIKRTNKEDLSNGGVTEMSPERTYW